MRDGDREEETQWEEGREAGNEALPLKSSGIHMLMLPASYAYCQQDLAKAYSLQQRLRSLAANERHTH